MLLSPTRTPYSVVMPRVTDRNTVRRVRVVEQEFSAPQYAFLELQDKIAALIGGVGSGKSHALGVALVDGHLYQGHTKTVFLVVSNTYKQLEQSTLPLVWSAYEAMGWEYGRDYVYNERPPAFWGYQSAFKKHEGIITLRNWNQVITRSLEKYDSIRGLTVGAVYHDEMRGAPKAAFDVLLARMRCTKALRRMYRGCTTPNGFDWIYEVFVDKALYPYVLTDTRDNSWLTPDFIATLESSYDPLRAEQEIHAKFVALTKGRVYYCFDRSLHVRSVTPDHSEHFVVSFDFNRSPYSVVICQNQIIGEKRCPVVIDEVSMDGAGTPEACEEIIRRLTQLWSTRDIQKHPSATPRVYVYGDASGGAGSRRTNANKTDYEIIEQKFRSAFASGLTPMWRSTNMPVSTRVLAMNSRMRNAQGKVSFAVDPRCKQLIRDLERVSYIKGSSEIDKDSDKTLTHMSDAVGYFIAAAYPPVQQSSGRIIL